MGIETVNKNGEIEIENEELKISFNYVDLKDLNTFIHKYTLGTYSNYIKENRE